MTEKKLKLWNGLDTVVRNWKDPRYENVPFGSQLRMAVAAYSREDARRVCEEYTGVKPHVSEIKNYWSPCWGNGMKDVQPERGLWIEFEPGQPYVRVV